MSEKDTTILVLSEEPGEVYQWLKESEGDVRHESCPIQRDYILENNIGFIVSHGYRHILRDDVLDCLREKVINLHISFLPWNRGADPNVWSFVEDTPKGVSIHYVDSGIDTGDVLVQKEIFFNGAKNTLRSTYAQLQVEMVALFKEYWSQIKSQQCTAVSQPHKGSFHQKSDLKKIEHLLTDGWDTDVANLRNNNVSAGNKKQ